MIRLSGVTGVLAGSALAVLGFGVSVVIAPPDTAQQPMVEEAALPEATPQPPASDPQTRVSREPDSPAQMPQDQAEPLDMPAPPEDAMPADAPEPAPEDAAREDSAAPPEMPPEDNAQPETLEALTGEDTPRLPDPMLRPAPGGLPGQPVPPRNSALPETPRAPEPSADSEAEPPPDDTPADEPRLPGRRVTGLPGQSATQAEPVSPDDAIEDAPPTALERNSSFDGTLTGAPLMAVVLNDPGLPTPLRRSLAALELPVTIALNPMDPSASQAADIYREAGKDVLILANGLPNGARATDLDVTFGAWFDALPQAVGVLDLPRGGFARNANLTNEVLPLIARDGHGLVSFAGGLSRVASSAQSVGVPHAEVFRVLDDEDQSPFTIRRYLDRAVFQASQIGEVIVFGDATNDATLEALEMWRSDGRVDQVAVVPVSAILLTR